MVLDKSLFFFLGFISRRHCVVLLRGHDAYVAAAAIAIRLKHYALPQRVQSAVGTGAVTELGLSGTFTTGPKRAGPKGAGGTVEPRHI